MGSLVDSEDQLRSRLTGLVDDLDAVLWTKEPRPYEVTDVIGRAAGLLGRPAEEWRGEGFWLDRTHPEARLRHAPPGGAYTSVRSMIDLGHNLGLEVVAEGVEHPDDLPMLEHAAEPAAAPVRPTFPDSGRGPGEPYDPRPYERCC